jgi:hypothetical protein
MRVRLPSLRIRTSIPARRDADQKRPKLLVGAAPAEHLSDIVEIAGQEFTDEIQHQPLAEIEFSLAGLCQNMAQPARHRK